MGWIEGFLVWSLGWVGVEGGCIIDGLGILGFAVVWTSRERSHDIVMNYIPRHWFWTLVSVAACWLPRRIPAAACGQIYRFKPHFWGLCGC
jgi:hypothetical protein